MRITIFLLFIFALLTGCTKDNPLPPDPPVTDNNWHILHIDSVNNYKSIFFTGSLGYVVGNSFPFDSGKVQRSTDNGITWNRQIITTSTFSFASVFFKDASTGYICGSNGSLFETVNAGVTWNQQTSNTTLPINSISSADTFTFAVSYSGKVIAKRNSVWDTTTIDTTSFYCAYAMNGSTGFICGDYGTLFKTTNAGFNWTRINTGTNNNLSQIIFSNSTTGFICGQNGTVLKTTDGGNTWNALSSPTAKWLNGIYINTNSQTIYAVGEDGTIIRSSNEGASWTAETSPSTDYFRSIYKAGTKVIAVGENGSAVYRTY